MSVPEAAMDAARASIADHARRLGVYGIPLERLAAVAVNAAAPGIAADAVAPVEAARRADAARLRATCEDLAARLTDVRGQVAILRQVVDERAGEIDQISADLTACTDRAGRLRAALVSIEALAYTGPEPAARKIARDALRREG